MPQLLDRSIQVGRQQGSEEGGQHSAIDLWEMLVPVIDIADAPAGSNADSPMTEADYRAIMAWTTKLLSHPPRGSLPFAAAMAPMRLLVSVSMWIDPYPYSDRQN